MIIEAQPSFGGHETFPFRYTWLKKAVDAVTEDPRVFAQPDAMVRFGVGKNMVASIRHWALALGMIEEDPTVPNNRGRCLRATNLGEGLFTDGGWDPFLEDPGTLWLLHWQLASTPDAATTWWYVFNLYPAIHFTRTELQYRLSDLAHQKWHSRVSATSLKRDIDCFILTYSRSRRKNAVTEEALDCPLVELSILRESESRDSFEIVRHLHNRLPLGIFAFALLTYLQRRGRNTPTVSLDELAFAPGAPGRVFCIDESGLISRLEKLERLTGGAVGYDETSGLKQLFIHKALHPLAALQAHYASTHREAKRVWTH